MPGILNLLAGGGDGLIVSPSSDPVIRGTLSPTDCFAGVQFRNDGTEWATAGDGGSEFTSSRGNWLDVGAPSQIWVERTINSGSLNSSDPGAGRLQLSTNRSYRVVEAGFGTTTCNVTFDFYNAASGGRLLATVTFSLTAESTP